MPKVEDGGPAFPVKGIGEFGMSLRDWFAGQALGGLCATVSGDELGLMQPEPAYPIEWSYAVAAYRLADAMLAERKKGGE